ncbi:hypothetical protein LCI18_013958 [Fusarium solani-melongenae]|uniref:Uncharacterized protein n=1 Tax=Fusarium solani subsp. cucurbitae TaxID=2747967 RepID=A0ACD3ZSJ0_FUSSC|nr:hypothetical protein LCI18_013958 [Fusarium solani-melongenae]
MGDLSSLSAPELEKYIASVDIGSKLDDCERISKLSINVSPASASIHTKQQSLPTDGKYQYGKVNPYNTGPNTPRRFDAEVASCVIRGKVPPEIDGTFYRTACDPQYANRTGKDTWINSDGAIQAWRFSNGEVDFKQRFVRTPRFIYERIARKSLFGAYRNPFSADERVVNDVQSSGNTHIQYWYGLLLVLKEDSPPIALDPDTLETLGIYDFEGQINPSKTFTAHPKIDIATGETMGYGMEAAGVGSNELAYFRFDKNGKKIDECWVKTPDVTWTHEMVATDNWVVFHMSNSQLDLEHMKKNNGTHFRFNRWLPNRYGVLPRRNPKPENARFFDTLKNHFWAHLGNGFEGEDGCIYIDAFVADYDLFKVLPNMHPELDAANPTQQLQGKLLRFKIDPKAESNEMELPVVLSEVAGEMVRCDDRYISKPHNHLYGCRYSPTGFDAILHVDVAKGETNAWVAGEGVIVGEPCFVPRSPDSPEGDGWLVTLTRDAKRNEASLTILDATKITDGPVAVVELPFQLCEGVHGHWVNADQMRSRKPLVDYSGVTAELQAKFSSGAPKPYDDFNGKPVAITRESAVKNPWL